MSNSRDFSVSLDHLVAEMAAFPFVARICLEQPTEVLDPNMQGQTRALWRAAERYFVGRFPHIGIDELVAARNVTWFSTYTTGSLPLHQYVSNLADRWLEPRGPFAEPKLPDHIDLKEAYEPAARRMWRWITFAMPSDLILAGLSGADGEPFGVRLLSPLVDAILRGRGFAETHLHMGAAFDFPTVWAAAVNIIGRTSDLPTGVTWDCFGSPGADHAEGLHISNPS